jgi:hypothetical protein
MSQNFERPPKVEARDVIDYEIEMMEHCASRLLKSQTPPDTLSQDQLAFLEGFLLHFRILLEFFGKPSNQYQDNLYFQRPETYGLTPSAANLAAARAGARKLHSEWNEKLNKFLAHPTERRYTTKRSWQVKKMLEDMHELTALWGSVAHQ